MAVTCPDTKVTRPATSAIAWPQAKLAITAANNPLLDKKCMDCFMIFPPCYNDIRKSTPNTWRVKSLIV